VGLKLLSVFATISRLRITLSFARVATLGLLLLMQSLSGQVMAMFHQLEKQSLALSMPQ
jgi:hypothetical protein